MLFHPSALKYIDRINRPDNNEQAHDVFMHCCGLRCALSERTKAHDWNAPNPDELPLIESQSFWRGYLDVRASITLYGFTRASKIIRDPMARVADDPRVLRVLIDFAITNDYHETSRRNYDPFAMTPEEIKVLEYQAQKGRIVVHGDLCQKLLWQFYPDLDRCMLPRHEEAVEQIIFSWDSRAKVKLQKRGLL